MNEGAIELGELLHQYRLGLVLVAGNVEGAGGRPVEWVHSSELEDPTPFLPPRTVLLTTGTRFRSMPRQEDADAYVQRLIDAGTTALGVAIGLHRDRVPPRFITACDRLGLPLLRVPYATAFISIAQTAARLIEARSRARDHWAIESHRAIANASLHSDGLGDAVREAGLRLGRWICIADRSGRVVELAATASHADPPLDGIRRETRRLIEGGRTSAISAHGMRLQTLGRQGRLLGVLAVEDDGTLDAAERTLLELVTALATVQLEQRSGIDDAQAVLRDAIVHLMLAGDFALAEQLSRGAQARIPLGQLVAVRFERSTDANAVEDLRSLDAGSPGLLRAMHEGRPILVSEARHLPAIRRHFTTHRWPCGISGRGTRDELAGLAAQAERGLAHALSTEAAGPIDYQPALHDGVLRLLDESAEARRSAETLLAPVRQHDARHGDSIERSLASWLAHHGQTSPAAAELGVHRHTLRARMQTAAQLLQADLDSPDTRADLWTALRLAPSGQSR